MDVELGSFVADDQVQGPTDVTPLGDLFSRKRRQVNFEQVLGCYLKDKVFNSLRDVALISNDSFSVNDKVIWHCSLSEV